ncbi:protein translocase subunit SecD [Cellulomonas soli]|uniref:protein translocase subunit SecD n=1 Tax=Cellulomonas soli TaxID=931535 RepID=UPI003F839012
MAPPTRRQRPVRTLTVLGLLILAIFGAVLAGTKWSDASLTPNLALDLEGGTQIILKPIAEEGDVSSASIDQAIEVIRQRVDSSGVAEAEILSQGDNIVVSLPGHPSEETLDLVRTSATMQFRPVLAIGAPTPVATDTATDAATAAPTAAATAAPADAATAAPTDAATEAAADPASETPTAEATAAPSDVPTKAAPDSPSDAEYYLTEAVQARFNELDCTDPANLTGGAPGDPDVALVTCDPEGTAKYVLGPVELEGSDLKNASSGLETNSQGVVTNTWIVDLAFNSAGTEIFADITERLQALTSPQNQFAMVLDGLVISAPSLSPGVIINDGRAQISGTFTRESAATLANQLNFGALPLTFEVQSEQQISATLGSDQLQKGLIAGLIGLILVVIYSLLQYRALGLVTVASLVVAALVTYGVIALLSWTQGYRLSLPGVAGLIVAIGITADSFIVYFERIRDELREGRPLAAAVERGWERARRTILASDAVNLTAAVVLYLLAVGGVQGFAFTLGLTTLIDVLVVFCFTHPVMALLARTRFFADGHPASGLDPRRLGAQGPRYVGRGRVATLASQAKDEATGAPAAAGLTIAERRAAARAAAPDATEAAPATASAVTTADDDASSGSTPSATTPAARTAGESGRTEGSEL